MVKDKNYNKFRNVQIDPDDACIDPLYKTFLENVKKDGNSYVFEMKGGDHGFPAFVKYEKEYAQSPKIKSESDITFKCKGIHGNDKGPASIRSCPKSIKQSCSSSDPNSQLEIGKPLEDECLQTFVDFKRELMIVLNKPYNHNEYQILLREATGRKPLLKMKNLRSITISYETKQLSSSYLEYYPDLAKQIECANSEEALILLRGFFFWLKNLCHEGAYRPWSDHF